METAADDVDWDARALDGPLAEAASLLGTPLPDIGGAARRVAGELRDSALDLQERTRLVLVGGPDMNEGLGALERIRENFTLIESRGKPDKADGLLSRRDLRWAVHYADSATSAAAGWLLDHDLFFDQVETAKHNDDYFSRMPTGELAFDAGDRDGLMSRDDIDAFLDKTAARSTLMAQAATIDAAGTGQADGVITRADLKAFLDDYQMTEQEADAVQRVLDDRAHHTESEGGFGWGTLLDVVSFVPVVGDVVDGLRAIYYVLHGDYGTAALFALGVIPLPMLSSSGLQGGIKVVKHVHKAATTSGRKEATKVAGRLAAAGTAANYAAYQGATQVGRFADSGVDIRESVDYVLDDVLGPQVEGVLDVDVIGEDLDPQVRQALRRKLEHTLTDKLDPSAKNRLSEANTVIARRMAEHQAFEAIFRKLTP